MSKYSPFFLVRPKSHGNKYAHTAVMGMGVVTPSVHISHLHGTRNREHSQLVAWEKI